MTEISEFVLFDFRLPSAVTEWLSINDGVMGGNSDGSFKLTDRKTMEFFGTLSLENNGGFASMRTRPKLLDFQPGDALRIRLLGDGRQYSLNLYVPRPRIAFSYRAAITTTLDKWIEVLIPLTSFQATSFGRPVQDSGSLDPNEVNSIGFMVSDKIAGTFKLEIDWIKVMRLKSFVSN